MSYVAHKGRAPGNWHRTQLIPWNTLPPYGTDKPKFSAVFYCPNCGKPLDLVNHTIGADGSVTPSVVEHGSMSECNTFHDYIKLEGYTPDPLPGEWSNPGPNVPYDSSGSRPAAPEGGGT